MSRLSSPIDDEPLDEPAPDEVEALLREAGWVRALARRLARDQAAAEDVAQGALTLALVRRPGLRGSLRPWLARVALRLARRERRAQARRAAREERAAEARPGHEPGSDELLERLERQEWLAREVRRLSEPYRGVLLRHYYEGLCASEIARLTGSSAATVRSQLARGLERLRARATREHELDGVLPFFLLAAGSGGQLLPRLGAELLAMKTTIKLTAVTALVAATLYSTGALSGAWRESKPAPEAGGAPALAAPTPSAQELEPQPGLTAEAERELVPLPDAPPLAAHETGATATGEPNVSTLLARIVDERGRPLEGAQLRSIFSDGRPRGAREGAFADSEGQVELAIADEHMRAWQSQVFPMLFAASAEGRATDFVVSTPSWHARTQLGDLVLGPGGALAGLVVDGAGAPISGAVLYAGEAVLTSELETLLVAGPDTSLARPRAQSDASGRFLLSGIAPDRARLFAHAPDHLWTISQAFAVSSGTTGDCGSLVLEEVPNERRVRGLVLCPDGTPAAGARVAFESNALSQGGEVLANARGEFSLVPRGDAPLNLVASDPAQRFGLSETVAARVGDELLLRLGELARLQVRVVDSDGLPLAGAMLMAFLLERPDAPDGRRVIPGQDWIESDADGQALVPLPPEPFTLQFSRRGYKPNQLGPFEPASAPRELLLELERAPHISGRVLLRGEPVAGMQITIAQHIPGFVPREAGFPIRFFTSGLQHVESDAEGRFSAPVGEDWIDVTVLATGAQHAAGETELTLEAGRGASGVEVELFEGGSLSGRVLPPEGRSAHGLVVAASRGDGHPVWARADAEGRFRLEHLAPGSWRVEGREREPVPELFSVANRPEDKEFRWNVEIVDGREQRFDVDMRGQGAVELSGRFLVDGAAPVGWSAELVPGMDELQRESLPAVELDSAGDFRLTAPAGRYDLRLLGQLEGGAKVEVLRELRLTGPRQEWRGALATGLLRETIDREASEVRLVRGRYDSGEREITLVPLAESELHARVPVGSSSLQVQTGRTDWGPAWTRLRQVEVR